MSNREKRRLRIGQLLRKALPGTAGVPSANSSNQVNQMAEPPSLNGIHSPLQSDTHSG